MREKTPNFWILGNACSDNKSDLLISSESPKKQEATYFGQKKKNPRKHKVSKDLVETAGLEPVTSCV